MNCFYNCTSHVLTQSLSPLHNSVMSIFTFHMFSVFHLTVFDSYFSKDEFPILHFFPRISQLPLHLFLCSFICLRFHSLFRYRLCALSCCLFQKPSIPLSSSSFILPKHSGLSLTSLSISK